MDILKQLLEKFDSDSINKLANFIGDPVDQVSKAVELSVGSLLNGLVHECNSNEGVEKVLKVIKDGGHSGDILDDLSGLLSNPDKTQLLITIGTNINNHFFVDSISNVSDKIAQFSEVKKTSSSSILSFAAPLVLGFLGKQVKVQRLSPNAFGHYMRDEESSVKGILPPSLATMFSSSARVEEVEIIDEESESKKNTKSKAVRRVGKGRVGKEGNTLGVLAWVLLGGLILAALYYAFRDKIGGSSISFNNDTEMVDSLSFDNFEDSISIEETMRMPESIGEGNDQSFSKISETVNSEVKEESSFDTSKQSNDTIDSRKAEVSTESTSDKPNTNRFKSYAPVVSQLGNSRSWAHFGAGQFKPNSAELRNQNEIQKLANYLNQNPSRTLRISGVGQKRIIEDRAYAIREALYLKGIPLSRVMIENGPKGDGGSVRVTTN